MKHFLRLAVLALMCAFAPNASALQVMWIFGYTDVKRRLAQLERERDEVTYTKAALRNESVLPDNNKLQPLKGNDS